MASAPASDPHTTMTTPNPFPTPTPGATGRDRAASPEEAVRVLRRLLPPDVVTRRRALADSLTRLFWRDGDASADAKAS